MNMLYITTFTFKREHHKSKTKQHEVKLSSVSLCMVRSHRLGDEETNRDYFIESQVWCSIDLHFKLQLLTIFCMSGTPPPF